MILRWWEEEYLDSLEPEWEVVGHQQHSRTHTGRVEQTCCNTSLLDDARGECAILLPHLYNGKGDQEDAEQHE